MLFTDSCIIYLTATYNRIQKEKMSDFELRLKQHQCLFEIWTYPVLASPIYTEIFCESSVHHKFWSTKEAIQFFVKNI